MLQKRSVISALLICFINLESVHAACIVPITAETLSHFIKDSGAVLFSQANRNDNIIWRVRMFATAGIKSLKAIEKIIPKANLSQKIAIGEGLARANIACNARDGEISHRINDVVRRVADRDVTRAYLKSLTGDIEPHISTIEAPVQHKNVGLEGSVKLQRNSPLSISKFK